MTRLRLALAIGMIAAVVAVLPARAAQPAAAVSPAADPDATCLIAVAMVAAGPGADLSFMGEDHDRSLVTLREASFFYGARITQRHQGAALDAVVLAADRALPRNRFLGIGGRCMTEYSSALPGLGQELEQALRAAGVPRNRPEARTPADAATLDPDLICVAVFTQARGYIERQGAQAPASITAMLPTVSNGMSFFGARALARLPAGPRGALLATALRSVREDQLATVMQQCSSRMRAEMARVGRAAQAAIAAQEQPGRQP